MGTSATILVHLIIARLELGSPKHPYVMALIACFGLLLDGALQNTLTFPLQTISADPVQQRGHEGEA